MMVGFADACSNWIVFAVMARNVDPARVAGFVGRHPSVAAEACTSPTADAAFTAAATLPTVIEV
jgi:hypothetical protein